MARVTVEDCIDKVDSPYELVLVAKERATQLNSGLEPTLERDNDKNTVISLREIAEEIQVSKEDLAELKNSPEEQTIDSEPANESADAEGEDVSLDNLKDEEIANTEQEDSESTNS